MPTALLNFNNNKFHPATTFFRTDVAVTVAIQNSRLEISSTLASTQGGFHTTHPVDIQTSGAISIDLVAFTADNCDFGFATTTPPAFTSQWANLTNGYRVYTQGTNWVWQKKVASVTTTIASSASGGGAGKNYKMRINPTGDEIELLIDDVVVASELTYSLATYSIYPYVEANIDNGTYGYWDNLSITYNDVDNYPLPIGYEDLGYVVPLDATPGNWDYGMYSAISPTACVKRGSTYYLYYVGTESRVAHTNRSLGVATSTDGRTFSKSVSNPIISYHPIHAEEGIFSVAAHVDSATNDVYLYVGRCTDDGAAGVNCDIALYTSTDGISFTFNSIVVAWNAASLFDGGDEVFPLGVYQDGTAFRILYTTHNWRLGMINGTAFDTFDATTSKGVPSTASPEPCYGGANISAIDGSTVMFLNMENQGVATELHTYIEALPSDLSSITKIRTMSLNGSIVNHQALFRDTSANEYLMFYKSAQGVPDGIGLMVAADPVYTPPVTSTGIKNSSTLSLTLFNNMHL